MAQCNSPDLPQSKGPKNLMTRSWKWSVWHPYKPSKLQKLGSLQPLATLTPWGFSWLPSHTADSLAGSAKVTPFLWFLLNISWVDFEFWPCFFLLKVWTVRIFYKHAMGGSRFGTVFMQFFSSPVTFAWLCLLTPFGYGSGELEIFRVKPQKLRLLNRIMFFFLDFSASGCESLVCIPSTNE